MVCDKCGGNCDPDLWLSDPKIYDKEWLETTCPKCGLKQADHWLRCQNCPTANSLEVK